VGGEGDRSVLLQIRLLKSKVDAAGDGGQKDQQRPRADTEALLATDGDHGDPEETDGYAGPAPDPETLPEKTHGQKRGEKRDGGDDEARHPGAGGELSIVERHVIEGEGEQARKYRRGNVPDLRQTHAGERGVDGERHRGHEHAQQGQRTGRIGGEGIPYGGVSRSAEHDGSKDGKRQTEIRDSSHPFMVPIRHHLTTCFDAPGGAFGSRQAPRSYEKLAAIMTPAANPSIASRSLRGTFLAVNTSAAMESYGPNKYSRLAGA
jgi:hypothetical protein